jgi:tetratricopeptide (TPR) repeat protein
LITSRQKLSQWSVHEPYVRIAAADLVPLYEQVEAPRASPAWAWAQLRLGQMHLYDNKPGEALNCYQAVNEAVPPGPERMMALIGAGLCCEKLQRSEEAKRHYQPILQLPDISWYPSNDLGAWGPVGEIGKGYWFNSTHVTAHHLLRRLERRGGG